VLDRFQIHVDPKRLLADLRPADHTMVAIARALQDQFLAGDEGILVLDEPTVALPSAEVDVLFSALRQYARAGQTILLVTHRLEEVISIADRVTVLRDGNVVATLDADQFDYDKLVELIVGRALDNDVSDGVTMEGEDLLLEVSNMSVGPLQGVTFGLRRGEVLGVAGLLGSGRTTLLTTLFGLRAMAHGTTKLDGQSVAFTGVDQAMDAGLAFVPENRSDSAFLDMDLRENLSAADVPKYWHRFVLHQRQEAEDARRSILDFSIKANSVYQPFSTLSGGNQQKAVVARWLRRKPRLLLLDEPTQGVDIEARGEIYRLVRNAVTAGTSVIVVTSDFEELARVADRVLVLAHGRIAGELRPPQIDASRITELVLSASAGDGAGDGAHEMENSHP
jgi:ribose transport system ATP-binding protein